LNFGPRNDVSRHESYEQTYEGNFAVPGKIFIADDVAQLRTLYSVILKLHGYDVILVASSGEEVVKLARDGGLKEVEIAIFDYSMGAVNGLEAAVETVKSNPRIRIIIGSANEEIATQASVLGFAFLKKPFSKDELLGLLSSIEQDIRESRYYARQSSAFQ
jgi:DNA-binding NtrC family response regulator